MKKTPPLKKQDGAAGGMKPMLGGIKKGGGGIKKMRQPLQPPDVGDPMEGFDLPDEPDPGKDAEVVLGAAALALRDKRAAEQASMELTTDGRFYFCAIFDTGEQKMAFLRAMGLLTEGDIYIDGRKLADKCGVEIPEVKTKMPKLFRVDKKLGALAMPIPGTEKD